MKQFFKMTNGLVAGAFLAGLVLSAHGDVIFNNSSNSLGRHFTVGSLQVGDEIGLAGSARYLTNFSFEYWGSSDGSRFAGSVECRVKFYVNDGSSYNGYATPGTLFYDSGWLSDLLTPTTASTVILKAGTDFAVNGLFIPVTTGTMTWTVQFRGLGTGDLVGLNLYSPATVGTDDTTYWQDDGGWMLCTNSVAMSFGATFEATIAVVPEPTVVGLILVGGMVCVAASNRRRQS